MDRRLHHWLSRMCGLRGWLTCGLWIWLWMVMSSPAALAQLDVVSGVINVKDTGSGPLDVKFFYESSAADAQGMLHVEVVGPKGPSLTERTFEIVFYINSQDPSAKNGVAFRTFIKMAEGATTARAVIPFFVLSNTAYRANNQPSMNWDLAVLEEGRDVEQSRWVDRDRRGLVRLSPPPRGEHQVYHTAQAGHSPTTLLYLMDDGEIPNMKQPGRLLLGQGLSGLGGQLDVEIKNSYLLPSEFGLTRNSQREVSFRHVSTAPKQWQYYLQYRIVVIESAVLSKLQASQPLVAQALKHFVTCGGSLIVRAGQTTGARRLLDQWLLGSEATNESPSQSRRTSLPNTESLGWESVRAQYGSWWQRGADWGMQVPVDPTQSQVWGGLNQGISKTQIDGLDGMGMESEGNPAVINEIRRAMSELRKVDQVEGPQSLTLPGILRDSLTLLDTILESKLSSHREMWAEMTYVDEMDQDLGLPGDLWPGSAVNDMSGLEAADGDAVLPDGAVDGSTANTDGVPAAGVPADAEAKPKTPPIVIDWKAISPDQVPTFPLISLDASWVGPLMWQQMDQFVTRLESGEPTGISIRPHGLGRVGLIERELTQYPVEDAEALVEKLPWSMAAAVRQDADEAWAFRNMIDAVGKPPVWTFCAIVLLFGLTLGPGLLLFTGWMRRRSLMILLVPLISMLATVAIISYEVLHEGFGTSIRVTSLLTVDEPSGAGFAWSRQTYFSGWPDREGLVFPAEVYFRSVPMQLDYYSRRYSSRVQHPRDAVRSVIDIQNDGAIWNGVIRAREQQQFLLGHPAKVPVPLKVTPVDTLHIKLKNFTDQLLPFVILRDATDGYYLVENLAAGNEVELSRETFLDVAGNMARLRAEHMPNSTPGMRTIGWGSEEIRGVEVIDRAWKGSLAEKIEESTLPPFGFVTLTARSDAIYVPVQGEALETQHLMVGRLLWSR